VATSRPWDVPDGLWELVEPLLPKTTRRFRYPGRKRIGDREALSGILFVLYTAIPWEFLPQELGFGSGMTCWRRLRDWQADGTWEKILPIQKPMVLTCIFPIGAKAGPTKLILLPII